MTALLLLIIGVFLAGLGFGIALGWWMRGEMWLAHQVTGKTMDFTRRRSARDGRAGTGGVMGVGWRVHGWAYPVVWWARRKPRSRVRLWLWERTDAVKWRGTMRHWRKLTADDD